MTQKIFLIRHGESQQNSADVLSGVTDIPMTSSGFEQCKILMRYFHNVHIDKVYSSSLLRARQTAGIIFPALASDIKISDALMEFDYGSYEGYERSKYSSGEDEIINRWITSPSNLSFPDGGNIQEHANCSYAGFLELIQQNEGLSIACVSHRTTIRLIMAQVLKLNLDFFRSLPCSNCGITEFAYNGSLRIVSLNVTPDYLMKSVLE